MLKLNPKNMLITGGAGFIGSHFVLLMLEKYPELNVINLDKLTYAGTLDNLQQIDSKRYQFKQLDICNRDDIENLLRKEEIDCIVHFAAESHVDRSIAGPEVFLQTNIMGTFNLLESARKVWLEENHWTEKDCRFHHISTDEVFGTLTKTDPAFCETTAYAPNSPYSASKAGSDHIVRAYYHTYGLPYTLSNCSNNYGPHQHDEKLIPTIIRNALNGNAIPIYGDGSNIRDWLYVTDHCEAIDRIIHQADINEIYTIGGNAEQNNLAMAQLICQLMAEILDKPVDNFTNLIEFVTDRAGHDWRYAIDANKIKQDLDWQPRFSLEDGLRQTIKWYLNKWQTQ